MITHFYKHGKSYIKPKYFYGIPGKQWGFHQNKSFPENRICVYYIFINKFFFYFTSLIETVAYFENMSFLAGSEKNKRINLYEEMSYDKAIQNMLITSMKTIQTGWRWFLRLIRRARTHGIKILFFDIMLFFVRRFIISLIKYYHNFVLQLLSAKFLYCVVVRGVKIFSPGKKQDKTMHTVFNNYND